MPGTAMARCGWVVPASAAAVLVTSAWLARSTAPVSIERPVARAVVGLPDLLHPAFHAVMQVGTRGAALVLVAVLLLARGLRDALGALVAGGGAWIGSVLVKALLERPRPIEDLLGLPVRVSVEGWGYPSSHSAIAAALAVYLALVIPNAVLRVLVLLAAAVTMLARVYIGAHWPLDVVGGAAIGVITGWYAGTWVRQRPASAADPQ